MAWYSNFTILGLVAISVLVFVAESLPELDPNRQSGQRKEILQRIWFVSETVIISIFTAEYLVRLWSAPRRIPHMKEAMNVIDLMAIIPYYVDPFLTKTTDRLESSGAALAVLRGLRLVRVFRILKLGKYSATLQLVALTLIRSGTALVTLLFIAVMGCVLFSAAIFYAEGVFDINHPYCYGDEPGKSLKLVSRENDDFTYCSGYSSILSSMWWTLVTMTTLGYGDVYPRTSIGKMVGVLCALCGILCLALPITVVGANFSDIFKEDQRRLQRDTKAKAKAKAERLRAQVLNGRRLSTWSSYVPHWLARTSTQASTFGPQSTIMPLELAPATGANVLHGAAGMSGRGLPRAGRGGRDGRKQMYEEPMSMRHPPRNPESSAVARSGSMPSFATAWPGTAALRAPSRLSVRATGSTGLAGNSALQPLPWNSVARPPGEGVAAGDARDADPLHRPAAAAAAQREAADIMHLPPPSALAEAETAPASSGSCWPLHTDRSGDMRESISGVVVQSLGEELQLQMASHASVAASAELGEPVQGHGLLDNRLEGEVFSGCMQNGADGGVETPLRELVLAISGLVEALEQAHPQLGVSVLVMGAAESHLLGGGQGRPVFVHHQGEASLSGSLHVGHGTAALPSEASEEGLDTLAGGQQDGDCKDEEEDMEEQEPQPPSATALSLGRYYKHESAATAARSGIPGLAATSSMPALPAAQMRAAPAEASRALSVGDGFLPRPELDEKTAGHDAAAPDSEQHSLQSAAAAGAASLLWVEGCTNVAASLPEAEHTHVPALERAHESEQHGAAGASVGEQEEAASG